MRGGVRHAGLTTRRISLMQAYRSERVAQTTRTRLDRVERPPAIVALELELPLHRERDRIRLLLRRGGDRTRLRLRVLPRLALAEIEVLKLLDHVPREKQRNLHAAGLEHRVAVLQQVGLGAVVSAGAVEDGGGPRADVDVDAAVALGL